MSTYTIENLKADCKSLVEKAKAAFSTEKVKFTEAKLEDGTIISYDGETLMANMPVFVIDEKGNQIPLMDGTYNLPETKQTITVVGGVATEVKGGEASADPNATAQSEAPKPEQKMETPVAQVQPKTVVESIVKESRFTEEVLETEFKKVSDNIAELKAENEALKVELNKQTELNKNLFSLVSKIADEPADTKVVEPKDKTKFSTEADSLEEKIKALHAETFKN